MPQDRFPASEFDEWADSYDTDITSNEFPFTGYQRVIETVVEYAQAQPGMSVLDLGTGTGELALRFRELGCQVWATDFSAAMLAKARARLPEVVFIQADLRGAWPEELERRFDCIVSTYVFHHFELEEKVRLIGELAEKRRVPGGRIVIADISFEDDAHKQAVKQAAGENWDEELYWIVEDALPALRARNLRVEYTQVSDCAGVYVIT
jgi:putative AdoMet-dependent methyltransferase